MTSWCLAHPWMTFFVAMSAVGALRAFALALASALRARRKR